MWQFFLAGEKQNASHVKRQNHKAARVSELLAVPRYADVISGDLEGDESDSVTFAWKGRDSRQVNER